MGLTRSEQRASSNHKGVHMVVAVKAKAIPDEVRFGTIFERRLPVNSMYVHLRSEGGYARPLNPRRLAKMVKDFDQTAVGVLLLSMRNDGSFAIIDGQHRRAAAMEHGITHMDAYVYIDLTIEDEARKYRQFGETFNQSARDRYLAALVEGDPIALEIDRIVRATGLHVPNYEGQTDGGVQAVEALYRVHAEHGPQRLREALHFLYEAFGVNPKAYVGPSIRGAAMFLDRYGRNPIFVRRRALLIDKLAFGGVSTLAAQAAHFREEVGSAGASYGKAILTTHNKIRGDKLADWITRYYDEKAKQNMRGNLSKANAALAAKRRKGAGAS